MITNERQYKITKRQLGMLQDAIKKFNLKETTNRLGSDILANAEFQALESEANILEEQLLEYESLQSGAIVTIKASSLDELPEMLIRARIAQHLTQRELGDRLGLKEQQIQRYESEKYVSASLRRLKEVAEALKITINETVEINSKPMDVNRTEPKHLEWSKFPIKEMYRRGWFEEFSGSLDDAMQEVDTLVQNFVAQSIKRPTVTLYRKSIRSDSTPDPYSLLAWQCRILNLAIKKEFSHEYQEKSLNSEWISNLIKLSVSKDGPLRAKEMLEDVGIALIIEPYLPNTYLDGAALLNGEYPVIGMTLRYDRVDNFWFVLLHELFHIIQHLRKGKLETIFDDLDSDSNDKIEQEADLLAEEALIPKEKWSVALPRYVRSKESIENFAADLGINPAIIAGRIRHESNNYIILNELVGQGGVRKQFPGVSFGI